MDKGTSFGKVLFQVYIETQGKIPLLGDEEHGGLYQKSLMLRELIYKQNKKIRKRNISGHAP